MAIQFQYNKTSLQLLDKQLKVRVRALPTIMYKESALRLVVKKAKDESQRLNDLLDEKLANYEQMAALWSEFDTTLVAVKDVVMEVKKIAGVKTPVLKEVIFETKEFSLFSSPSWFLDGIQIVKELAQVGIEREIFNYKVELLDHARKKTTQKVNLFEKVQIPGFEEAIRKVKRFMEDEENLSKAAQKIVKSKKEKKRA
jgi:V/A-type H+-transporting ATPase subunit D